MRYNNNKNNKNNKNKNYYALLWIIPVIIAVFAPGCSSVDYYKKEGMQLFRTGEYDQAVEYFENAVKENPEKGELKTLLFKAKLNSYYYHLARARKLREIGKKDDAIREYRMVLDIFPANRRVSDEMNTYISGQKKRRPPFKSTITPPVTLNLQTKEKITLNLKNKPITQIFKMVGKSYNVNFIFDKDFRDFVYTIEIENIGFYQILNQLCMVGNAEYRVLDSSSVLVYPATTFKKRTFGLRGVKVFYLANTAAEDAKKLVMTVFRDQQILAQEDKSLNTLIIKADSGTLSAIEKFIYSIDKEKPEVEIDVEILELNRNLLQSLGADYGTTLSTLSMGQIERTTDDKGVVTETVLNTPNVNGLGQTNFFITLPAAAINFLESNDSSRLISKPNLRGIDGEDIKFMVGDEIPIPQTQFQAGAAGGISNIPVTSYKYENVGVEVKITPTIHGNGDVTLKIKLTLRFITGVQDNFPLFGKRELESVIRLKEGETSIVGGFIRDELRGSLKGFPGLAKIPILGKLFGATSKDLKQTDLIFSVTPRLIRRMDVSDEDNQAIWANASQGGGGQASPAPGPRDAGPGRRTRGNSVVISPAKRRVRANTVVFFSIQLRSTSEIESVSFNGSISGGSSEITELNGKVAKGAKVLQNHSGDSFDLGYTFEGRTVRNAQLASLKVKFAEPGNYTVSIGSVTAYSKEKKMIALTGTTSEIEVYGTGDRPDERGARRPPEKRLEKNRNQ